MDDALLKKLKIKTGMKILGYQLPDVLTGSSFISTRFFDGADALFFFAYQSADLKKDFKAYYDRVAEGGLIWIFFPKKSAKVQTDLSRDKGWDSIENLGLKPISLVSFDDVWSAFGAKKLAGMSLKKWDSEVRNQKAENPYIDKVNRIVRTPEDLMELFAISPEAEAAYHKLAFTHKKEYIEWITDAKKAETRQNRLVKTIEMLTTGRKNPSDKG